MSNHSRRNRPKHKSLAQKRRAKDRADWRRHQPGNNAFEPLDKSYPPDNDFVKLSERYPNRPPWGSPGSDPMADIRDAIKMFGRL